MKILRVARQAGSTSRWRANGRSNGSHRRFLYAGVFTLTLAGAGVLGYLVGSITASPQERSFTIKARRYAYDPPVIRVNRGDVVRLRLVAMDVVHGFYLEGHDIDAKVIPMQSTIDLSRPSRPDRNEIVEEVVFKAEREGKFRYRCSQTCGYLHPFMLGELIVEPNRFLPTSIGLAIGLLLGSFFVALLKGPS